MHSHHDFFSLCYRCIQVIVQIPLLRTCYHVEGRDPLMAHCLEPITISSILLISIKMFSDFVLHSCLPIPDIDTHTPEGNLHEGDFLND